MPGGCPPVLDGPPSCGHLACIDGTAFLEPFTKGAPIVIRDPDIYDPDFAFLPSPPSSPSTGSAHLKRARRWSDNDSDGQTSESEAGQKRAKSSPNHNRRLLRWSIRPPPAFVDKTRCIRQLPSRLQCLLLRPPGFGKTTFLSTLAKYYDVHEVHNFGAHFGSLEVFTQDLDSTPRHNQHLCLGFNLLGVFVDPDLADVSTDLPYWICQVLGRFLGEYATELRLSIPLDFQGEHPELMFAKVFELSRAQGYTLFVSIDDYDAPVRERFLAQLKDPTNHDKFPSVRDVMRLLDIHLWRPLLAGADVIDKLFVTGILPVNYPALESVQLDSIPDLQLSCGFTEQESLEIAQWMLERPPNMAELQLQQLQRSCGGYIFPNTEPHRLVARPLLHPQLAIAQISSLDPQRPSADVPYPFDLLEIILELLPKHSDVPGAVTITSLIDVLAAGAVEVDETDAGLDSDATAVTWNILHHAGAFTYDHQMAGMLRVSNSAALSQLHVAVDTLFSSWYELEDRFLTIWAAYSASDMPNVFVNLLSKVLRNLGQASFGRRYEPTMHGVLELVMRNALAQPSTKVDAIILPAPKRIKVPGYVANIEHVWELNTLTLQGIWRAANPNEEDTPTVENLRTLHEELVQDDEESLLKRPYTTWSTSLQAMETRLVGDFFDREPEYPQFLAVGGARVLLRQRPRNSRPIPTSSAP
ncbi:hypothetical protein B0H15DRAFT_1016455 [Mycena belliarum]|uniref:AAA-ATPase-like domain-containing protein n=1 Tax=Mycena belliarum TaxID=1033014 RepID=A0AAD6XUN2_9AGAR|nr:hypothetical protein B0H15DRAFT_1016455 [Mycena belliae]